MNDRKADDHRRKARRCLREAGETTDLNIRQQFLNLCERELAAAAATRHGEAPTLNVPKPDRRKKRRSE